MGDGANEKTCNAHSEGPRKCHGNSESKKHTKTSQLDGNSEQFLFVFVHCLCVNLYDTSRLLLLTPPPAPIMPSHRPKHFGKLKSLYLFYLYVDNPTL